MRDPTSTTASRNASGSPSFERIRIEHLTIGYEAQGTELRVMEDVSFDIQRGEILCIIGPSGCGKSSILNTLCGFVMPVSGRVAVEGGEGGLAALRRGVVFQEYALFPWRTARRNVEFGLQVRGLSPLRRKEVADWALGEVGLAEFADYYPHRLSGGMRQRVAVARALAFDPDILLMDEPFAALDEEMREELQDLVIKLWQETSKTFIYVTHSIQEAVFLATRVIVLAKKPGRVRAEVAIEFPHPRDRLSDQFHAKVKELTRLIRQEN